jgi:ABC-2 type transport system ATP-binding protein
VTAAIDKRVDAIVPTIAWNNLNTSLAKMGAPKTSWGLLLGAALLFTGARTDPQIYPALINTLLSGSVSPADKAFLDERSPSLLVKDISAPTLFVQGTVDTLFTLAEADLNAKALLAKGVPTKVVWYCGGHGGCATSRNDGTVINDATLAWLGKYVKGLPVSTGPQFQWVDQHGRNFSSDKYPVPTGTALEATTDEESTLPLNLLFGGSGPNLAAFSRDILQGFLGALSASKAANAVDLTLKPQATTQYIVGAPQLEFTYSGTGSSTHVYAQLVDDTTGLVLGNHVTPIEVTLDGQEHVAKVPMEMVAHTLAPGETVTLQIVASAITYQPLNVSGQLDVKSIKLTLPTADATKIHIAAAETAAAA